VGARNRLVAVDKLNLCVNQGEIFGFLGPNGAGKTTCIKITMGFLKATSGQVAILGKSNTDWRVRERVGFLPENPNIYPYLNGRQALAVFGRMFSLRGAELKKRIEDVSEQLGLDRELRMPLGKHSKGMLQRVGLAQALINDPDILILDEPMSGLDPIGRRMFREVILRLKQRGKTVFFSSHILSDIEMLCDRVGMISRGRLVLDMPMSEILEQRASGGRDLEQIFMEKVGAAK
jgi:ABC-2 type transport system ATP-binding protein